MSLTAQEMTVQQLQLEIIERSSFNNYDGKQVRQDLERFSALWKAVILDRHVGSYSKVGVDTIRLRDLDKNIWNADTLLIKSSGTDDEKLELLAKSWDADEVRWAPDTDAGRVLVVWWD